MYAMVMDRDVGNTFECRLPEGDTECSTSK